MLPVDFLRQLACKNPVYLFRGISSACHQAFSANILSGINIPEFVTNFIIMFFNQKRCLQHQKLSFSTLLFSRRLFFHIDAHRRVYNGIHLPALRLIGKNDCRQFPPVQSALRQENILRAKRLTDPVIALRPGRHQLMGDLIRKHHAGIRLLRQVSQYFRLAGSYTAGNSYKSHRFTAPLFCLIPVTSRMHINLKHHRQLCCPVHLFGKNLTHFLLFLYRCLHQQFIVHRQNQPGF